MSHKLDPSHIMQTATGFWASKVLLTAVELELFTTLADDSATATQLGQELGLHPRGIYDFFDALVALNFLDRDGDGSEGRYKNTPETAAFLNKKSPTYIGGMPEMLNGRVRWIASEAMFTPYFALTERDRGHLTYAAKIDIETDGDRLPDGIPVSVEL